MEASQLQSSTRLWEVSDSRKLWLAFRSKFVSPFLRGTQVHSAAVSTGLSYMLKKTGAASPGPAFTVHLEVDYKRVSLECQARCRTCHVPPCHALLGSTRCFARAVLT